MEFDWDEEKRRSNIAKHGLDFADAQKFGWEEALFIDDFPIHGEARVIAIGPLANRLVLIVFTLRGDTCRIISMRNTEPKERKLYRDAL
ncbi:MAG: BrnT family toxin [Pseudomonadota bacterium]